MAENNEENKRIIGALVQCAESGKPLANAKVYQTNGNIVAQTNGNGLASLAVDENLKKSVQVEAQGYKSAGFPIFSPKKDGKPYVFSLKKEKETENQTKYAEVIPPTPPPMPKPKSNKKLYVVIVVLALGLAVVFFLYVKEKRANKGGLPKPPTPIPAPKPKVNPTPIVSKPKVKMV